MLVGLFGLGAVVVRINRSIAFMVANLMKGKLVFCMEG